MPITEAVKDREAREGGGEDHVPFVRRVHTNDLGKRVNNFDPGRLIWTAVKHSVCLICCLYF